MANTKQTDLADLTEATIALGDKFPFVDVSDTSMAASGTNKEITLQDTIDFLRVGQFLPSVVYKTADEANSTTTLSDAVGNGVSSKMGWAILASASYMFEFVVFATAAATTTGMVLAVNGPTIGAGVLRYGATSPIASATTIFSGGASAYATKIIPTGIISTTVPTMLWLNGYIKNGTTAGNLVLQFCSEVAASAANMLEGSWGRLTRLA